MAGRPDPPKPDELSSNAVSCNLLLMSETYTIGSLVNYPEN